jgi:hypothetical protein
MTFSASRRKRAASSSGHAPALQAAAPASGAACTSAEAYSAAAHNAVSARIVPRPHSQLSIRERREAGRCAYARRRGVRRGGSVRRFVIAAPRVAWQPQELRSAPMADSAARIAEIKHALTSTGKSVSAYSQKCGRGLRRRTRVSTCVALSGDSLAGLPRARRRSRSRRSASSAAKRMRLCCTKTPSSPSWTSSQPCPRCARRRTRRCAARAQTHALLRCARVRVPPRRRRAERWGTRTRNCGADSRAFSPRFARSCARIGPERALLRAQRRRRAQDH